jgi:hypothetical protein
VSEQSKAKPKAAAVSAEPQEYVVQRLMQLAEVERPQPDTDRVEVGKAYGAWVDVATVTVPPRTHRKTVVERAFEQAGVSVAVGETVSVRVLDADSARVLPVGSVQPPPQLTIGGAS